MSGTNSTEFQISDLIGRAWSGFTANVGPFIGAVVVSFLVSVVVNQVAWRIHPYLSGIATALVGGPFLLGFYKMGLQAARGQGVQFGALFDGFSNFLNAGVANVLICFFCMLTFPLLIVPGVIVYALYITTFLFMADGTTNFWEAMESSRKFTLQNFTQWILVAVVALVLIIAGWATCGVLFLVTAPVSVILVALAYDQQRHGRERAVEPEVIA